MLFCVVAFVVGSFAMCVVVVLRCGVGLRCRFVMLCFHGCVSSFCVLEWAAVLCVLRCVVVLFSLSDVCVLRCLFVVFW